jgi:hypothetical protein
MTLSRITRKTMKILKETGTGLEFDGVGDGKSDSGKWTFACTNVTDHDGHLSHKRLDSVGGGDW